LLESGIFKCISRMNGSFFFRGDNHCFMKERVKTFIMAPMSPLDSRTFLLSPHLYSRRWCGMRCPCSGSKTKLPRVEDLYCHVRWHFYRQFALDSCSSLS
jgi:hypothetical protein